MFAGDQGVAGHRELVENTTLVLLNRRVRDMSAALMDSAGGMRQSVDHLVALGHQRIAFLSGPRNSWSNKHRLRGLRAAVERTKVDMVTLGPFAPRYSGGVQAADLALAENVTAIIAYNDIMALGALARMHERGIDVPGELSLTGFDDLVFAAVSAPRADHGRDAGATRPGGWPWNCCCTGWPTRTPPGACSRNCDDPAHRARDHGAAARLSPPVNAKNAPASRTTPPTMTGTEGCSPCTIHAAVNPAIGTSSANGMTLLVGVLGQKRAPHPEAEPRSRPAR